MGIFQQFPYSNFHEMNLDQIIKIMRQMQDEWEDTKTEWASYKDFIDNYFENLDVSDEVLEAMRIFASDGTLNQILDPTIATETTAWLAQHITQPTTPAIDTSLTVAGAGADSKTVGDMFNADHEYRLYITETELDTDWVVELGVTVGLLQSDGTTSNNINYRTTGLIPVTYGKKYVTERPGQTAAYTLYRCTYDSNLNLIEYIQINATSPLREYTPMSNVAYVRFSVSANVFNNGFRFRLRDNRFDLIEEDATRVRNAFDYLDNEADTRDWVSYLGVTVGLLQNDGTNSDNINFITTDYMPVDEGDWYVISRPGQTGAYSIWRCTYDSNYNLISYLGNFSFNAPDRDYEIPLGVAYVRFSVSVNAFSTGFTFRKKYNKWDHILSKMNTDFDIYNYNGTKPALDIEKSYYCMPFFKEIDPIIPAGLTMQAIAIYKNILFQFMDSDLVRLYDINDMGTFIGDVSITCGHGNSAQFSNVFANANDEFPLVYVSDTTGNVYVNQISRTTSTLVRTLYFDETVFGYTPQLALDNKNNVCYVVGSTNNILPVTTLIISKCDLSNLTDNGDSTYTPAVIETYQITPGSIFYAIQGCKYVNGDLYICSGGGSHNVHSDILIINTSTKTISNAINNFPEIPTLEELEDIEFYPNPETARYDIIMHIRLYGYYKLVFN